MTETVTTWQIKAVDLRHPDDLPRWVGTCGDETRAQQWRTTEAEAMNAAERKAKVADRWRVDLVEVVRPRMVSGGLP